MKNRTLQSIIFASVVAIACSVSHVNAAEASEENLSSQQAETEKSAKFSPMQEEMLVVLADTQLFDIEAYKASMTNAILVSAKQLLLDATRGQTYLASN